MLQYEVNRYATIKSSIDNNRIHRAREIWKQRRYEGKGSRFETKGVMSARKIHYYNNKLVRVFCSRTRSGNFCLFAVIVLYLLTGGEDNSYISKIDRNSRVLFNFCWSQWQKSAVLVQSLLCSCCTPNFIPMCTYETSLNELYIFFNVLLFYTRLSYNNL